MIIPGIVAASQPSGPAPYHASAVHFDGTSKLINSSLVSVETNFLSFVYWLNQETITSFQALYVVDPAGDYHIWNAWANLGGGFAQHEFTTIANGGGLALYNNAIAPGSWVCIAGSVDINAQTGFLTKNGVDDIGTTTPFGAGGPTVLNGKEFWVGDDGFGDAYIGDMADFRLWADQRIDWSNPTNIAAIIDGDGKPVNPSVARALFGTPTIELVGNASAFGNNTHGSGGAFTPTNLTNASTSPSD